MSANPACSRRGRGHSFAVHGCVVGGAPFCLVLSRKATRGPALAFPGGDYDLHRLASPAGIPRETLTGHVPRAVSREDFQRMSSPGSRGIHRMSSPGNAESAGSLPRVPCSGPRGFLPARSPGGQLLSPRVRMTTGVTRRPCPSTRCDAAMAATAGFRHANAIVGSEGGGDILVHCCLREASGRAALLRIVVSKGLTGVERRGGQPSTCPSNFPMTWSPVHTALPWKCLRVFGLWQPNDQRSFPPSGSAYSRLQCLTRLAAPTRSRVFAVSRRPIEHLSELWA